MGHSLTMNGMLGKWAELLNAVHVQRAIFFEFRGLILIPWSISIKSILKYSFLGVFAPVDQKACSKA